MKNLKLVTVIIVVFILGVLVGISGSSTKSSTTIVSNTDVTTESIKETGKVEVKSQTKRVNDRGHTEVVGDVINNTSKLVTYVKVTATFYDQKNVVIGTSFTYVGDTDSIPLGKDATAPFEVTSYPNSFDADHYKLDVSWR